MSSKVTEIRNGIAIILSFYFLKIRLVVQNKENDSKVNNYYSHLFIWRKKEYVEQNNSVAYSNYPFKILEGSAFSPPGDFLSAFRGEHISRLEEPRLSFALFLTTISLG